ncbi:MULTISPECIES: phenylacetate--CoA ligase PaaK [Halolamina]|uniref:Phenylacetate-CoA ligase n=1 Tax=Halolamina pelagica TaxID=699431 RepID=A0A1I5NT61_9EURY|nr:MULTISPECIES: phenylacetate--CoA ligase PaaK [Halolamina]NHX36467.1 phenylacetate--CoA ligase [Halolamina sp. R1-12]SFP25008.1 phenylacetate-CoA ligase [Halolamina pelagica]
MVHKPIESADRSEIRDHQAERLRETVERAYENVPFYREKLDEAGVAPADIRGVEDVTALPMTTKEDFRDEYPDGLFAVDDDELTRIHASSGTTGKPKIVGYTDADVDVWSEVVARSLAASGVEAGDTVQNAYGYGLFTGGLGLHYGVEELGATVIPIGGGQTQRQIELMADLESDVFTCTPSYALYLAETAEEMGHDPRDLPISTVIFGAEPCTDPMREEIEERLGVTGIDIYGLSEIIGPGVSNECHEAQDGLHVWEDHFYPEVVDPRTGEPVEEGEEGELVLTTLTKEALPVLRYRTGDLTTLTYDECECGRTMVRMDNVTGRADDLLIVRGVNLYPSEIEHAVLDVDGVAPHYRIDLDREENLDVMELTVERAEGTDRGHAELREEILERLANVLSFTPDELSIVEPGGIARTEVGKVQRVYDHRS